jgi:hypothetical protein
MEDTNYSLPEIITNLQKSGELPYKYVPPENLHSHVEITPSDYAYAFCIGLLSKWGRSIGNSTISNGKIVSPPPADYFCKRVNYVNINT